ncbi:MAG: putative lipid II flippase FtsW [Patescibacteria group bacterium]|nr:putative lipid II flippase FtsW [Patescibacteria group bacterium]
MVGRKQVDYIILVITILLVVFGLIELASASSDLGKLRFNNPYYYLEHQTLFGLSLGLAGMLGAIFIPYKTLRKLAPILLVANVIMILLLFTPLGVNSGGAERWLRFGGLEFQPTEFIKITLVLYLASWLSSGRADRRGMQEGFIPFVSVVGFISAILLLQHSTSATILLWAGAAAVYFVGGMKTKYMLYLGVAAVAVILLAVLITPYRLERVLTFLHPNQNTNGAAYQINQSLITIGSGGFFGVGYGQSKTKKYLPARINDSIFAVIAEEFGFLGAIILITTYLFYVLRCFILAKEARDQFGRLVLIGFASIIGVQVFVHVGAASGLIPLTGVPLPYISYGGSSLAAFMTMSGILLNVSRNV